MRQKKHVDKKWITVITVVIALISCIFAGGIFDNSEPSVSDNVPIIVSFLDVGQGDCELISCEGYNILIDGGEAVYADKIEKYILSSGIEKLDYYILTHPHSDHIGAAEHIIKNVPIDNIVMTTFSELNIPTTKTYEDTLLAIGASSASVVIATVGDKYELGDLSITVLSPSEETDDYNNMSVVVKAEYKNSSFLFMGDASSTIENRLLSGDFDMHADVLKIGHHGSHTSSSESFIKSVAPSYAVISCGANNSYGHPHKETLNVLMKNDIQLYRTDYNGTIVFYGDGRTLSVRCEKQ